MKNFLLATLLGALIVTVTIGLIAIADSDPLSSEGGLAAEVAELAELAEVAALRRELEAIETEQVSMRERLGALEAGPVPAADVDSEILGEAVKRWLSANREALVASEEVADSSHPGDEDSTEKATEIGACPRNQFGPKSALSCGLIVANPRRYSRYRLRFAP